MVDFCFFFWHPERFHRNSVTGVTVSQVTPAARNPHVDWLEPAGWGGLHLAVPGCVPPACEATSSPPRRGDETRGRAVLLGTGSVAITECVHFLSPKLGGLK